MNRILIILLIGIVQAFASAPSMFIGTYVEKEANMEAYISPNQKIDKNDRWGLTAYTEKLLNGKYKSKLEKVNLILRGNFTKNTEKILSNSNIRDRKMSFIHVDGYQNFVVSADEVAAGVITFNLTYVEVGEEPNRMTSQDTFETRYTKGITFIANTALNEKFTLEKIYKKGFDKALGKLLDAIISDNENKVADNLSSDDIYFIIQAFKVKKAIKKLANEVFGSEDNAQRQLTMMLQETLIRKIRKDKELNDVVLLYPSILSKYIFKNWDEYLTKIKEFSTNDLKDRNAQIVIRDVKQVCKDIEFDGRFEFLDGYRIQAMLTELNVENTYETSTKMYRKITTGFLARTVIPLYGKVNINSMSLPDNIIKDPELFSSVADNELRTAKALDNRRDFEILSLMREILDKLSNRIFDDIKQVVEQRKEKIVIYKEFCKGK